MFMLYSVVIGLALGLVSGGSLVRLGEVRLRWAGLAVLGLATQLLLFSSPLTAVVGDAGPPIYIASMAVVLGVVLLNLRIPGLPVIALGAASNLAAIVANGGYMPASAEALAALGGDIGSGYTNSSDAPSVALAPLTDIFATPTWVPFANVFSIGDVVIGLGVVIALVVAMRDRRLDPPPPVAPEIVAEPVRDGS